MMYYHGKYWYSCSSSCTELQFTDYLQSLYVVHMFCTDYRYCRCAGSSLCTGAQLGQADLNAEVNEIIFLGGMANG